jgi:RNA polymerase sigma-70 factor (ECF subfamily)
MATRHDLVIAARAGDGDAFMDLVQLETPDAFRLSLAIMRHYFDAEDALQEAFVRAWRELPRLHDPERWQASATTSRRPRRTARSALPRVTR